MIKGRNNKNSVRSQPLFDVQRQYLWTFLIDLQAEVSGFAVEFFTVLLIFSKLSSIIIKFYLL